MKKTSVIIASLMALGSASAQAESFRTAIASVEPANNAEESTLVYLESEGRVLRLDASQGATIDLLSAAAQSGDDVVLNVSDLGQYDYAEVVSVEANAPTIIDLDRPLRSFVDISEVVSAYAPSDLGTPENVTAVFATQTRRLGGNSQCYQRAHVWAYDMFRKQNITSMKVFLFFTSRYIRAYNYKWWFHVAPYVMASGTEYVMDRTFMKSPKLMKEWTDNFMKGKWACPTVERYSDYRDHQAAQYCYLAKVPMFYYQPKDVKALEEKSVVHTTWNAWSLSHANRARY